MSVQSQIEAIKKQLKRLLGPPYYEAYFKVMKDYFSLRNSELRIDELHERVKKFLGSPEARTLHDELFKTIMECISCSTKDTSENPPRHVRSAAKKARLSMQGGFSEKSTELSGEDARKVKLTGTEETVEDATERNDLPLCGTLIRTVERPIFLDSFLSFHPSTKCEDEPSTFAPRHEPPKYDDVSGESDLEMEHSGLQAEQHKEISKMDTSMPPIKKEQHCEDDTPMFNIETPITVKNENSCGSEIDRDPPEQQSECYSRLEHHDFAFLGSQLGSSLWKKGYLEIKISEIEQKFLNLGAEQPQFQSGETQPAGSHFEEYHSPNFTWRPAYLNIKDLKREEPKETKTIDPDSVEALVARVASEYGGILIGSSDVVSLVTCAVFEQLKTVIKAMINNRRESSLHFSMGNHNISIFKSTSEKFEFFQKQRPSLCERDTYLLQNHCHQIGVTDFTGLLRTKPHPLSTWDLFHALQIHRDAIPNNSVYAPVMEKLIAMLNHPTEEEIEQQVIYEKTRAKMKSIEELERMNHRLSQVIECLGNI